ncbi:DUF6452 family protein [Flavobacterium sangjuense]|uniref:Uncharacterized protein n=1 Tax=Flavobacterium sangjuense TaxID=2518177 RepID=A0A4V1CC59_9FLAO|nr:DUF6452 family protein [Flavobacterium sangjuense]QBZ98344.1 hypothetical protein GS03_01849 [Flavobacterium sangjuense]
MKKILALLLITISLSSCEKDDICIDETTPRLILEFYDVSNPANLKAVVNLKVKAVGAADFIVFNTSLPETDPDRYLFNGNKLELPLNITQDTTKYSLILNSTSSSGANEDSLQFNYTRQNVFVSRACGYKTIFELNAFPTGVIKTDGAIADGIWIQDINILTTNIETENETHIKILF